MKYVVLLFVFAFCTLAFADNLRELYDHGGEAVYDLTIKDDRGALVEGAKGIAYFWTPNKSRDKDEAYSDEKGHLVLKGESYVDGNFVITKDGYYESRLRGVAFEAQDKPFGLLERRRWKPVVRDVVLKKIRNPIAMRALNISYRPLPRFNSECFLDLEVMDWVAPDGEGIRKDLGVTVSAEPTIRNNVSIVKTLTLRTVSADNGILVINSDTLSSMIFPYETPLDNLFKTSYTFSIENTVFATFKTMILFRIRTVTDTSKNIISAHYGKREWRFACLRVTSLFCFFLCASHHGNFHEGIITPSHLLEM